MTPVGAASASYYYAFTGTAKAAPDTNADAIAAARTALAQAYGKVDSNLSNHVLDDVVRDEDMVDGALSALTYAVSRATPSLDILV